MVPLALPFCPETIEIHESRLVALHPQPLSVVTLTDKVPPEGPTVSAARPSEYVHGAAAWLTATVCEPTTIEPERAVGTGLAATV